ncbi:hypothetical protein EUGRSUZ_B00194 [Eucalyptus grandis]|uniref:Uncharacterized protein n=2 Tax=Eucalyptus grandis TaxID=71139 RepID=A0ACC3LLC8_EUCGR|nr:hypothetical protein EUGRSUZ_B00194 [Eucalyptus grandis]
MGPMSDSARAQQNFFDEILLLSPKVVKIVCNPASLIATQFAKAKPKLTATSCIPLQRCKGLQKKREGTLFSSYELLPPSC